MQGTVEDGLAKGIGGGEVQATGWLDHQQGAFGHLGARA